MAAPKILAATCPTCGANLPVSLGVPQITCRYCQNVIQIEHRKPPPEVRPLGTPGSMPSRTLYVDPDAVANAGKGVGCIILLTVVLPIAIAIAASVGPWAMRSCKGALRPFPIACGVNEEIEVSGNWEGPGPVVTSVGHNCKLHIKNAKLKGSSLLTTSASNLELTLENVTVETTDVTVHFTSGPKVKLVNTTLTSAANIFEGDSNFELEAIGSTLESKVGSAVKSAHNLKVRLEDSKLRGKKAGLDTDANLVLTMKKGSEVTSSEGPAVKTSSSFKLDADGGKIDGAAGGLVVSSGANITATGLAISSKEKAIVATSSLKLDYTDGSITSLTDVAIDGDSSLDLQLVNVKVQGATDAIKCQSSMKIKLSKKTRLIASTGHGVVTTSTGELNASDASIEAGAKAFKGTTNLKVKLGQGARLAGKKGGVEAEGNLELDGTAAILEGGAGPGIQAGYNSKISFRQGVLKGNPAFRFDRKPSKLELEGTRIEGEQKLPGR